MMTMMMMMMIT